MPKGKGGSPKVKVTPTAAGKDKKSPFAAQPWASSEALKKMPFAH